MYSVRYEFLPPSIAYLFIPLSMPFAEHKFLVLMRSSFINFFFMAHTFCVMSKNSSPSLENFLLCVLQKVSQFYPFSFKSMIIWI